MYNTNTFTWYHQINNQRQLLKHGTVLVGICYSLWNGRRVFLVDQLLLYDKFISVICSYDDNIRLQHAIHRNHAFTIICIKCTARSKDPIYDMHGKHYMFYSQAWASNELRSHPWNNFNLCIYYKVWDEITYSLSNFNGSTFQVWEWISNSSQFIIYVITYSCWD